MPAIAVHHTATSDESWDGPANVARLRSGEDRAYYSKEYAWRDPEADDTTKAAYKLPHHHVDHTGAPAAAVMAGCSAAIAALNGGRGGVDIPDADRAAVHAHLAAHMRDGDMEPPPLNLSEDMARLRDRLRASSPRASKRPWYRIQNAVTEADTADVWIYDEISWLGVTAQSFVQELQTISARTINLHLNSPGGDVFDGIAIYNALRYHPARVVMRVEGIAASIASVIAMAGDEILMAPHSMLMIHDPWALVIGNAADLRKEADVLDQLGQNIAGIYRDQGGGKVSQWRNRMLEETWLSDEQAVELGLADRIDAGAAPAQAHFDLSMYRNAPAALVGDGHSDEVKEPTRRDAEAALRDAGFSRQRAKSLVANGWWAMDDEGDGEERDVPSEPVAVTVNDDGAMTDEEIAAEGVAIEAAYAEVMERQSVEIAAAARARTLELYRLLA